MTGNETNVVACMLADRQPRSEPDMTWREAEKLVESAQRGEIIASDLEMRRFLREIHRRYEAAVVHGTTNPEERDWKIVVDSVCEAMGQDPYLVLSKHRSHKVTAARHVVACIWVETHTMQETIERLKWATVVQIYHARKRASKMLRNPIIAPKIRRAMRLISERAPHLMIREVIVEPEKVEKIEEFS
jgi:hypothetical protein